MTVYGQYPNLEALRICEMSYYILVKGGYLEEVADPDRLALVWSGEV
jgi:hypothetical protein